MSNIYSARGISYSAQKRYHEAIKDHTLSIQVSKNNKIKATGYYNIACAYSLQKRKDEALKYLSTAIDYGYNNVAFLEKDKDLNFIRDLSGYSNLLAKISESQQANQKRPNYGDLEGICERQTVNQSTPKSNTTESLDLLRESKTPLYNSWESRDSFGESSYEYNNRALRESIGTAK